MLTYMPHLHQHLIARLYKHNFLSPSNWSCRPFHPTMRFLGSILPMLSIMLCTTMHVVVGVAIPIEVTQHAPHHAAKVQGRLFGLLTHIPLPKTFMSTPAHPRLPTGDVNTRSVEASSGEASDAPMNRDDNHPSTSRKRTRRPRYHP